jgi:hypothetical protein
MAPGTSERLSYVMHVIGLVPQPLISHDFTLTEMVSLIRIETMKKSEVRGPEEITPPKIQITSRELSFWGVLVYTYLGQIRAILKNSTACTLTTAITQS